MPKKQKVSAGILLYRVTETDDLEVLLVHPGGPFFVKKDAGVWSVPKGQPDGDEELLAAAFRELDEETGFSADGPAIELGTVTQKSGKIVHAWAVKGDADVTQLRSNEFKLEWPSGSGKIRTFPEVDRAEWFQVGEARKRINPAQEAFLDAIEALVGED
jgi:predicted NUDIX family NTP pyrophosphohydrolase